MKIQIKILLLFCFSLSVLGGLAQAVEAPRLIPFQGTLTNQAGEPYTDGQYSIIFTIYDQPVGGSSLWQEQHDKVGIINGTINAFLGAIKSLDDIDFSESRHLGITIDEDGKSNTPDPEMVPRQLIVPAFSAKNADNSDKLAGHDWSAILVNGENDPTKFITAKAEDANTLNGKDWSDIEDLEAQLRALIGASAIEVGDYKFSAQDSNHNGWLICNGERLNRIDYPELFDVIGTTFNKGHDFVDNDHFYLPDLRGRVAGAQGLSGFKDNAGRDLTDRSSGDIVGEEVHKLTVEEIPSHSHETDFNNNNGLDGDGWLAGMGYQPRNGNHSNGPYPTKSTGGDQPHNNMQPTLFIGNMFIYSGRLASAGQE